MGFHIGFSTVNFGIFTHHPVSLLQSTKGMLTRRSPSADNCSDFTGALSPRDSTPADFNL